MKWIACFVVPLIALSFTGTGFAQSPHPWPMFRHDASRTAASTLPGPADPSLIWSYNPIPSVGGVFSTAAVSSGGRVYVGAFDNNLYCLTSRGALQWSYATEFSILSSPALGADGRVHIGSFLNLYSLTSSGSLTWSYNCNTGGPIESSPTLGMDGSVYIGSKSDNLFSLSSSGSLAWSYRSGENIDSSPALGSDGRVCFGAEDNNVYVLLPAGSLSWSYTTGDSISSSPAVAGDGRAYITGDDNVQYAFAPAGSLSWSYGVETGAPAFLNSSPALTGDGRLYVSSSDDNFYSFTSSGSLAWSFRTAVPLFASPVVGADEVAYTGGFNGVLYAFNSNGTLMWTYTADTGIALSSNVALGNGKRIFLSSLAYFGGGGLQCISERPPSLDLIPSSNSPAVGDPFTVDVTVKPIGGAFDAWSVILAPGGKKFSFNLSRPSSLRDGMSRLASNVPGLEQPFSGRLLSLTAIPPGAAGTYTIIVGLVPTGRQPTIANAIPDYLDQEVVVIH